jgi:hypothetical protein
MIRMNPAAPTLTFTTCPISKIRSHELPVSYWEPNSLSTGPGSIRNSSRSGIVPASVQRVIVLNSPFSVSRCLRSCRSATNGLNMYETAVRNRTSAWATRTLAA